RFDTVDERRSARRRRERPFESDHLRPPARDDLQRAQRLLIRERLRAAEILGLHERLQMLRCRDQYGKHRRISVNQNSRAPFKMRVRSDATRRAPGCKRVNSTDRSATADADRSFALCILE